MKKFLRLVAVGVLLANIGLTSGAQIAAAEVVIENDSSTNAEQGQSESSGAGALAAGGVLDALLASESSDAVGGGTSDTANSVNSVAPRAASLLDELDDLPQATETESTPVVRSKRSLDAVPVDPPGRREPAGNRATFVALWNATGASNVGVIMLTGNIEIEGDELNQRTQPIKIVGNNSWTIYFRQSGLNSHGALKVNNDTNLILKDLTLENSRKNALTPGSSRQPIQGSNLYIDGNVTIKADNGDGGIFSNSVTVCDGSTLKINANGYGMWADKDITVESGAAINATASGIGLQGGGDFTAGVNSNVTVNAGYQGIQLEKEGAKLSLEKSAKVTVTSVQIGLSSGTLSGLGKLTPKNGTLDTADSSALTVKATGTGSQAIAGFKTVAIGSEKGTGATLTAAGLGNVVEGTGGGTDSSFKLNKDSILTVNKTSGTQGAGIANFTSVDLLGREGTITTDNNDNQYGIRSIKTLNIKDGMQLAIKAQTVGILEVTETKIDGTSSRIDELKTKLSITSKANKAIGVQTGSEFKMLNDASMKITLSAPANSNAIGFTTGNGYGLIDVKDIVLMNTDIESTTSGSAVPSGNALSSMTRGITGATDVELVKNVNIGVLKSVDMSPENWVHDRKLSPRERGITASGIVRIGANNTIAGGGIHESRNIPTQDTPFSGIAIEAGSVEIYGSNNKVVSRDRGKYNTGISFKKTFKIGKKSTKDEQTGVVTEVETEANNNVVLGGTMGLVSSTGAEAIDIAGNNNYIIGDANSGSVDIDNRDDTLVINGIDTDAPKISIVGNENTISGRENGILCYNSGSPVITIDGWGNTIKNKWDFSKAQAAINIKDTVTGGTVEIKGKRNDTKPNKIEGYNNGIKTIAAGKTGGKLNIGGSTEVKSRYDMTAIAYTVNFTEGGKVKMEYIGQDSTGKELTGNANNDGTTQKKSVLWVGQKADAQGSGVTVEKKADVTLKGFGYLAEKVSDSNTLRISSPIHSSYDNITINGKLRIESAGNAINWYHDTDSGSKRGFAKYVVNPNGILELDSTGTVASPIQKLKGETSADAANGSIDVKSQGTFIAYGNGPAVFDLPITTSFKVINPKLIDFKNRSGRPVFRDNVSSGEMQFLIQNTNISLWKKDPTVDIEGAPSDSYEGVKEANIKVNSSDMTITSDPTNLATDYATEIKTIKRLRSQAMGEVYLYYQRPGEEPEEFIEWIKKENMEPRRYGSYVTILDFLKDERASSTTPGPRYYELNVKSDDKDIESVKRLINKYNTAESNPGLPQTERYFTDFKGMTWEDQPSEDLTLDTDDDPSSPAENTSGPDVYHRLTMTGLQNFKTSFRASNYETSPGSNEFKAVSNKPTLVLKRIPFNVTINTTVNDGKGGTPIPEKVEKTYGYGETIPNVVIPMKYGYDCYVTVNGSEEILLTKEVSLGLQSNFNYVDPETGIGALDPLWKWAEPQPVAPETDASLLSKKGDMEVNITYKKGLGVIEFVDVPAINFGNHEKSAASSPEKKISAEELTTDLTIRDTYKDPRKWTLKAQMTEQDAETNGTYINLKNKKIEPDAQVELTNSTSFTRPDDTKLYDILKKTDTKSVQLIVPTTSWATIQDKTYTYNITLYLEYTPL